MGSHPDTGLRRLGVQGVVTVVLGDVLLEGRARWVVGLGLISPYIRPPVDELILCYRALILGSLLHFLQGEGVC